MKVVGFLALALGVATGALGRYAAEKLWIHDVPNATGALVCAGLTTFLLL